MKKFLKSISLVLMLSLLLSCVSLASADGVIEVTLPTYKTGENVGAVFFEPLVERFNAAYEGKYHITLEELTQDMYTDKIKQLGAANALPFLIEGGDSEWIKQVVIPNDMFVDLSGLIAENNLMDILIDSQVAYNTTADGKVFSICVPVTRPMGLYYNGAMLDLGGKTCAELSWDDVAALLGDNKIAFMTGENAWTTQLVLGSLIAVEEGGAELLSTHTIDKLMDYNQPCVINAVAKLQTLMQKYGTSNQIGAVYADAANAFMSCNAAIIANGSWMVGDFLENGGKWSNGFDGATVRGDVLPGNVALANNDGYQYWIPASATPEQQEVGKAFILFTLQPENLEAYMLAEGGVAPKLTPSEAYIAAASENKLLYEYVNAVNADTIIVPNVGDIMTSSIGNTEFGNLLPLLVSGELTPEAFCQQLTALAQETALD
ncbi:MAG: extracellular solute-binding protein [Clostridia bacterium]|nr:extracellular solute-binding protein [Clostridia bacterium]